MQCGMVQTRPTISRKRRRSEKDEERSGNETQQARETVFGPGIADRG